MTAHDAPAPKHGRLNLRLTYDADRLIRQAASLSGQDLTSFVLSAATDRARAVLAEDAIVRLSALDAEKLIEAMEREPASVPRLVELLRNAGSAPASDPAT
ncbi:MAG: hypothetical protein RL347_1759 [Actinomycetota bacterium]|jgi:uncharacterized protein (DUF1778 family)